MTLIETIREEVEENGLFGGEMQVTIIKENRHRGCCFLAIFVATLSVCVSIIALLTWLL